MRYNNKKIISFFSGILFILAFFLLKTNISFADGTITLNNPTTSCNISDVRISLNWTSSEIDTGATYTVLRKKQGTTSFGEIFSMQNISSYVDDDIDSATQYVYQIKAVSGVDTVYSNQITVGPVYCAAVLDSPINTSCNAYTPVMNLSWSSASGQISSYNIYRRLSGGSYSLLDSTSGNSYTDDDGIIGASFYNYYIETKWADGTSKNSAEISVEGELCAPTLNVSADCLATSPGGAVITLNWSKMLGVEKYDIYRMAPGDVTFSPLTTINDTNVVLYNDNLVDTFENYGNGGIVYYKILAIWPGSKQMSSASKSITIPRCEPFLSIENFCDPFQASISWTVTEDAIYYYLKRDDGVEYQVNGTSYVDDLDLGICNDGFDNKVCTLGYQVEPVGAWNSGTWNSDIVNKEIDCTPKPPSPAPVLDEPITYCAELAPGSYDPRIKLTWSASDNVTGYNIFRDGDFQFAVTDREYIDSGVVSNFNYSYRIDATGIGPSVSSEEYTVIAPNCNVPQTPVIGLSTDCENGNPKVSIYWSGGANTQSYDLYRGTSESNLEYLINFPDDSNEFINKAWEDNSGDLNTGTVYYYQIIANGEDGISSSESNISSIITGNCSADIPILSLSNFCNGDSPNVAMTWTTDTQNTDYYEIFREGYPSNPIYTTANNLESSWIDNNALVSETTYRYKIDAIGFDGGRSSEGYKEITTQDCSPPGSFTLNQPTQSCIDGYSSANLSWSASDRADYYYVDGYRLDAGGDSYLAGVTENTSYLDKSVGGALSFNGDYVYVVDENNDFRISGNLTVATWVNIDKMDDWDRIIQRANGDGLGFVMRLYDNRFIFQAKEYSSDYSAMSDYDIIYGNWYHVVGVYDGSSVKIYVNGVLQSSSLINEAVDGGGTALDIGRRANYNTNWLDGDIGDVAIYSKALSQSDVVSLMNGNYNSKTDLRGRWRFDEGSGNIATDSSNNGNIGYFANTPTWVDAGPQYGGYYKWQATAVGGNDKTTTSNETSSMTMNACSPYTPGLYLERGCLAEDQSLVNVRFSDVYEATKYQIYRKKSTESSFSLIADNLTTFEDWADEDTETLSTYQYYVRATTPGGVSTSDIISVDTLSCVPPSPPENVIVDGTDFCNGSYPEFTLTWDVEPEAISYIIYENFIEIAQTTETEYTINHPDIIVNDIYSYTIRSVGEGDILSLHSYPPVVINTDYCALSEPEIFVDTSCGGNTITWVDQTPFNTQGYKIYRDEVVIYSTPNDQINNQNSYTFSWEETASLNSLTDYTYRVEFVGFHANELSSAEQTITAPYCENLDAPVISGLNTSCVDGLPRIEFDWSTVTGSYVYDIYRYNASDDETSIYLSSNNNVNYTDRGDNSLYFDGVDDGVFAPADTRLDTDVISLEAWVKPESFMYNGTIISKWLTDQYLFRFYGSEPRFRLYIQPEGVGSVNCVSPSNIPVKPDAWNHMVSTYDGYSIKLYLDGVKVSECNFFSTFTPIRDNGDELSIGKRDFDTDEYNGYIDEVRVYGRVLSDQEVQEHYQGLFNNEKDLSLLLHFNEGEGQIAHDDSGNDIDTQLGYTLNPEIQDPSWFLNYNTGDWGDITNLYGALEPINSKIYRYKVKGLGENLESNFSNEIQVGPFDCFSSPDFMSLSQCSSNYNPLAILAWEKQDYVNGYDIYKNGSIWNSIGVQDWWNYSDNKVLKFDGFNYVTIPHDESQNITGDQLTMEAWVRWDVNPLAWALESYDLGLLKGWGQIIDKNIDDQYQMQHSEDNEHFEIAVNTENTRKWVFSTTVPQEDVWYQVVGVYNGSTLSVYVNGEYENSTSLTGNIETSDSEINIGYTTEKKKPFHGDIDEVRVYGRALSATEIKEHYQGVFNDEDELRMHWKFDESSGQVVEDSTAYSNDGYLGQNMDADSTDPERLSYTETLDSPTPGSFMSEDGYLKQWLLIGPFNNLGVEYDYVGESNVAPVSGDIVYDRQWKNYFSDTDVINLSDIKAIGNFEGYVGYAFAYIYSDVAEGAKLYMAHDNGVDVFLNGDNVYSTDSAVPSEIKVANVNLEAGINRLLIKVHNISGFWGFTARILDISGANNALDYITTWDSDVSAGTTYNYQLDAKINESVKSVSDSISIINCTTPELTLNMEDPFCIDGNPTLEINWNDDLNGLVNYWTVYRMRTDDPLNTVTIPTGGATIDPNVNSFIDGTGENNVEYEYFVTGFGDSKTFISDNTVIGTPLVCADLAEEPVLTILENTCGGLLPKIVVGWNNTENTSSYYVYKKLASETDFEAIPDGSNLNSFIFQYSDYNLLPNTTYNYRVDALNSVFIHSRSNEITVDTIDCMNIQPQRPTLSITGITAKGLDASVDLSWNHVNAHTYQIYRGTDIGSISELVETVDASVFEASVTTVTTSDGANDGTFDGQTYYYKVRAINDVGWIDSLYQEAIVPIAVPGDFTLEYEVVNGNIRTFWDEALSSVMGGDVIYSVYKGSEEEMLTTALICEDIALPLDLECFDTDPTLVKRFYRVTARNAGGITYSNVIEIEGTFGQSIWEEISPN